MNNPLNLIYLLFAIGLGGFGVVSYLLFIKIKQISSIEEDLDKIKSDFISILSHELRSPLAVIKASIDLLRSKHCPQDRREEVMERALGGIKRLTRLATDLTDLANMAAGTFSWCLETTNISDLLQSTLKKIFQEIEEKNITLVTHIPQNLPLVHIDPLHTEKIFVKLLDNAIKYSSPKGKVIVRFSHPNTKELQISISDSGCGIPQAKISRIFKKFEQVENLLTRSADGTGLGLPIAQQLVTGQGGKLWVNSKVGEGTTVVFTLPIGPPKTKAPREEPLP